jgi:hypothetical protein
MIVVDVLDRWQSSDADTSTYNDDIIIIKWRNFVGFVFLKTLTFPFSDLIDLKVFNTFLVYRKISFSDNFHTVLRY